ncbi:hypothetical protein N7513_010507 [Penicillium frequentans]|nr:hypothetical protein N7513_010507 [Penicillium glabrum]
MNSKQRSWKTCTETSGAFTETERGLASIANRSIQERRVEDYIRSLNPGRPPLNTAESAAEGDQESVAEEFGENEPYEGSLQHLAQMKHFILGSTAYQNLLRRLEEFVQPSLYSRMQNMVKRWSTSESQNQHDAVRYKLRNLITELQHVNPHEIQFDLHKDVSLFASFVGHYQHAVERWTGERWDWWPLPRCVCGEERSAEAPIAFVKRLKSMIRTLPLDNAANQSSLPPIGSNLTPNSALNNSQVSDQISNQRHGSQQLGKPPSNPSVHVQPSGPEDDTLNMSTPQNRVLFLARQGEDYRLVQICVDNLSSHAFFGILKKEYFRLRGILRGRFSVWRYSHCDFYKVNTPVLHSEDLN